MKLLRRKEKKNPTPRDLRRRARNMERRLRGVQRHHITYNPERIVPIFRGEHQVVTLLQRMSHTSRGFLVAIYHELKRLKNGNVYDLDMPQPRKIRRRRR